ncbi:MAG: hypothetical protein KDD82_11075 [Planctomycetes bacterium]|nr:hypothetical protein [Planctomycetota bacterium]
MGPEIAAILHGTGMIGLFSSRAFLPAFLTALCLRFGDDLPWISDLGLLQNAGDTPTWFTHTATLVILGLLSALELYATKDPDARQLLETIDRYLKVAISVLTYVGVLTTADVAAVPHLDAQGGLGVGFAGAVALGVWWAAGLRSSVLGALWEADDDDALGLHRLIAWAEDLWVVAGLLLLIVLPLLMLAGVVATLACLWGIRRFMAAREERAKLPCAACATPLYPTALGCSSCDAAVAEPKRVGFFGGARDEPETDLAAHRLRLIERGRCPRCATPLPSGEPRPTCPGCSRALFAEPPSATDYLETVRARVPHALAITAGFSLIPVVGFVPAVVYARLTLVAPFRRYLPFGSRFCLRWVVRGVVLLMIPLQWIPLLGGAVVPLLAYASYRVHRAGYEAQIAGPAETP